MCIIDGDTPAVLDRSGVSCGVHSNTGEELKAQILSNLLNNAAKYSNAGGRIVVRTTEHAGEAWISVRDSGVGIDPESMARLFDLFVRGPESERRHREGLGVGLALARRLAELHGGSLSGTSEGAGRGSEFTLRLPLDR